MINHGSSIQGNVCYLGSCYKDGVERWEIRINKKYKEVLGAKEGVPTDIELIIGSKCYNGTLRSSPGTKHLWISQSLRNLPRGKGLAHILRDFGCLRNQKLSLDVSGQQITISPIILQDSRVHTKILSPKAQKKKTQVHGESVTPERFLASEFWILSWNASVQRADLYQKGSDEKLRKAFRDKVIEFAEYAIIPDYQRVIESDQHLANIQKLVRFANDAGSEGVLKTYRIAHAQKLLNLQLKYLWCAGYTTKPPHCPVDRIMLEKTSLKGRMNWTQMDSEQEYIEAIAALQEAAGEMNLADWELQAYNRREFSR